MKLMTDSALADSTKTRQVMSDYTRIANRRLNNMHAILQEEHKSIDLVARGIRSVSDSQFVWGNALVFSLSEISRFIQLHDELAQLETGIENLVSAQLTPSLIPVEDIRDILTNTTARLAADGRKLCASTAQDVYEAKSFQFTRHRESLYIRLFLPYTRYPAMAVYRTTILPLPVAGRQQLTTELRNFPKWLIQDSEGQFLGNLIEPVEIPVVQQSNVLLHHNRKTSCVSAIFYDDAEAIRRTCEFSTRQAIIDPIYLQLNATTFVVHNLTDPQIICKAANSRPVSNSTCIPCMVTIGCSCVLKSAETRIPAPTNCEKSTQQTIVLHSPYNAAVLREFYDLANKTLRGDHLVTVEGLTPLNH
jgi:hypothetical protein